MTPAQAPHDDWERLYESYFDQAERLTDEIDRLAADVKDAKTLNRSNARLFQQMTEQAREVAAHGADLAQRLQAARAIADDAGRNAAASLSAHATATANDLHGRLGVAAQTVDGTIGRLRAAAAFTRAWAVTCALVALAGMAAGAGGMYWLLHRPPTEQEVIQRYQGVLLARMLDNASKKELAVLNAVRAREEARLRQDAAPER